MKDSGVEWIGEIPEDWKVVKLKYIASAETTGLTADTLMSTGRYPVYDANAVIGFINQNPINENYISVIKDGAGIGRTRLLPKNTSVTGTLNAIRVNEKFDLEYLYLILQVFDFNIFSVGSTIPHVYFKDYSESFLPYPCHSVQRGVVKKLRKAVERIDQIIRDVSEAIETLEAYKKSMITEAVTKGLDKNAEMKDSGIEWIGEIPKHWEIVRGKYLFRQRNEKGNSLSLQLLSPTQEFGVIPQSLYEELSGMRAVKLNQSIDLNSLKSIYRGDYCISLRSFQGGFEYSEYDGVVSPAYQVFYKSVQADDRYYRFLFKERGFIEKMNSYTMSLRDGKNIAFNDFGRTLIPYPPFEEQVAIGDYLVNFTKSIDEVIAIKQNQLSVLDKYKKSLIYEYVTGKREV